MRRPRSSCSSYMSCSSLRRTSCGPADSSARVIALIAISSGSSAGSIHRRRIKMLVSSMPCRGCLSLICAVSLMVQYGLLISPECFQVNCGGVARHGGELLPGDEPAALSQRDQLADPMAVPGDSEGLPVFDRVHDLP